MKYGLGHVVLTMALLSGCATPLGQDEAEVTIKSFPEGARIFEGSRDHGQAPVTVSYQMPPTLTTANSSPMTAVWASGVQRTVRIELKRGKLHYTFQRPPNAPGIEVDVGVAMQIRERQAQHDAEVGDTLGNIGFELGRALGGSRR